MADGGWKSPGDFAECRERPRRAEEFGWYEYRKAPLFDRLFTFNVATS